MKEIEKGVGVIVEERGEWNKENKKEERGEEDNRVKVILG